MELREQENKNLKKKLEVVQSENEFLWAQQAETVTANNSAVEVQPTLGMGEDSQPLRFSSCASDAMEFPRMKRRMQQLENELRRTKTKLLNAQRTMQVTEAT